MVPRSLRATATRRRAHADEIAKSCARPSPCGSPKFAPPRRRRRRPARARDRSLGRGRTRPVAQESGAHGVRHVRQDRIRELIEVTRLCALVNKARNPAPVPGNPQYARGDAAGILNSIGLENPARRRSLESTERSAKLGVPVIVNVAGYSVQDYVSSSRRSMAHRAHRLRAQRIVPERRWRDAVRLGSRACCGGNARGEGRDR